MSLTTKTVLLAILLLATTTGCSSNRIAAIHSQIKPGMTMDEVRAIAGKPDQEGTSSLADRVWTYVDESNPRTRLAVGFDKSGRAIRVAFNP